MLREAAARVITGLKQAGAKVPVISEISLPAEVVSVNGFYQPTLDSLGNIGNIANIFKTIPQMAYGKANGANAGTWYSVKYPKAISGAVPVAIGYGRTGSIISRGIAKISDFSGIPSIPSITIPNVVISKVTIITYHCRSCDRGFFSTMIEINCPSCGSNNIEEITGTDRFEKCGWYLALWNAKKSLGDWTVTIPALITFSLNWIRDLVAGCFAFFGYFMFNVRGAFVLAEALSTQVDLTQAAMQNAVNVPINDLNAKLGSHVSDINGLISTINSRWRDQLDAIAGAVNLRLNDLYNMWGIPSNMVITPLHVRNVTSTGFEFQSFGNTTCSWIALGQPKTVV